MRYRMLAACSLGLTYLACGLVGLTGLLWIDTIWEMSSDIRWVLTRYGLVLIAIAIGVSLWRRFRRETPEAVAQKIDARLENGGEFRAACDLAMRPYEMKSSLSLGMASMSVQRAFQQLKTLSPTRIAPSDCLHQPIVMLLGVLACIGGLACLTPGIAWNQIQRFLYPASDVPPYTGILIDLKADHESLRFGEDVTLYARVLQGSTESMTLVVETDKGSPQSLPMLENEPKQWMAILTRLTEPVTVFAKVGSSRSHKLNIHVEMTPQILAPEVVIKHPSYTRQSDYRGPIPEQGLAGLPGTRVQWKVSSNRPLRSGTIQLAYRDGTTSTHKLAPIESEPSTVEGEMELTQPGRYELSLEDVEGVPSTDRLGGTVTILEDHRPVVRILQPQPMSLATPDATLPVVVAAEDDYGVSAVSLYRSLNGSTSIASTQKELETSRYRGDWSLPLSTYGLEPGDEIQLFARAEDNDPSGPKGAESPITTIRIISAQDFQKMMVQQRGAESIQAKYQMARRELERLSEALREADEAARELQENPQSKESQDRYQEKLRKAEEVSKEVAKSLERLSQQAMPIDIDQELVKELQSLAESTSEMSEALKGMQRTPSSETMSEEREKLQEMLRKSQGDQKSLTENAIEPLQKMNAMIPLVAAEQRFSALAQQQRDLSERMAALRDAKSNDPAIQRRVAELESEQQQLKQELNQLLDEIEHQANQLPEDPELDSLKQTALEFANAVRSSDAMRTMAQTQQELLADHFEEAETAATKAAEILESFLSKCNSMGKEAGQQCKASFRPSAGNQGFGNSLEQMLSMMGMKPGTSGTKPGSKPGFGAGGSRGGYSMRSSTASNVGMYSTMMPAVSAPSRGNSPSGGPSVSTNPIRVGPSNGMSTTENSVAHDPTGQNWNSVPSAYREKVAEYFRSVSEKLNSSDVSKEVQQP